MRSRRPADSGGPRRSRSQLVIGLVVGGVVGAGAVALAMLVFENDEPGAVARTGTAGTTGASATTEPVGEESPSRDVRILVDRAFECNGRIDLDLVRVTMRENVEDAIAIEENCTGRIGRIEVDTWTADGIKVQNYGNVAHDLVIESGYVKCHDIFGEYHQDGVHVMGGRAITFRDLRVDCLGNSNFFLARGGLRASTPTDVVCEGCVFGPNTGQTLFWAKSIRSGVRGTTICTGRFRAIRVEPGAVEMVREGSQVLPHDDPSCRDVTGKGAAS